MRRGAALDEGRAETRPQAPPGAPRGPRDAVAVEEVWIAALTRQPGEHWRGGGRVRPSGWHTSRQGWATGTGVQREGAAAAAGQLPFPAGKRQRRRKGIDSPLVLLWPASPGKRGSSGGAG